MALAKLKKPAANTGPKLAKGGKTAKAAPKAKVKEPKGPNYNIGQEVEFVAYAQEQESPLFEAGERLLLVGKDKDEDQKTFYTAIRASDKDAYEADNDSVDGDQLYPAEFKKAEKLPVDPYAIDVVHLPELDEVLEAHNGDPLEAANAMQEAVVENTILLGGAISELYRGRKYMEYGDYEDEKDGDKVKAQSGWNNFCQENLGMGGRKAFGLITIYSKLSRIEGLDLKGVAGNKKIGWVKLEAAAGVITQENFKEILSAAEEQNVEDFKSTIRTDYVEEGGTRSATAKVKRTRIQLAFFEDQAEGVNYVLEQAQKSFGFDNLEQTVEAIFMQWAADHLSEAQVKKARSVKRKKQTELKNAGVDIEGLKAADAKLEEVLTAGGDPESE